ncbi:ribonuclease T2 family protein [Hyphomicrobium sp. DY-1]|uniref:ribonuclease T2 family protein n=1 Tax=Hyphomicrobium sp. DY-1 TaxID=3075650 RepID=UPI0039C44C4E
MLKPHLFLTVLVLVALGAYFAHFMSERPEIYPLPGRTADGGKGTTGSSAGTSGNGNSNRSGRDARNKQAYNDDDRWNENSDDDSDQRNVPGQFDYYALVLSWSPTYCSDQGRDDDTQCNRRDGRRYSFVLHGLWPQYDSGYPSNCRLPRRPFVPDPVINNMLDIMPSRGLVIHEYRAHGTCSGLNPMQYFALARRLFDGINIPERFNNPFESQILSAADVKRVFLQANPRFSPDMMTVVCGGAGGMLREVRLCLTKDGAPRRCGQNETRRNLCTANQVFVPPARSTARTWQNQQQIQLPTPPGNNAQGGDHLPGPQMNYNYGRSTQ